MHQREFTIGIDVGGTKILAVSEDGDGNQISISRAETPRGSDGAEDLIAAVIDVIKQSNSDASGYELRGVGVGLAGLVNEDGVFIRGPHLEGVTNFDLGRELLLRSAVDPDVRVYVDNDANMAAWAEFKRGAGKNKKGMVLATFGTGIGGGFVVNGALFRGIRGFAGEIGHHVVSENGQPCECGRFGCWEQYASGNALGRMGREAATGQGASPMVELAGNVAAIRGVHVAQAARDGDSAAVGVIEEYARWIAEGLANISNILDVDCFVLGGGVVESKDVVLEPVKQAYDAIAYRRDCDIVVAELGEAANAIGAADLTRVLVNGAK